MLGLKPAVQCCWMLVAGIHVRLRLYCAESLMLLSLVGQMLWQADRWVFQCSVIFTQNLCNYWIATGSLSWVDTWYGGLEKVRGKQQHGFLWIYSIANLTTTTTTSECSNCIWAISSFADCYICTAAFPHHVLKQAMATQFIMPELIKE